MLNLPRALFAAFIFFGFSLPLSAVIFHSTADPNFNTTAPTGILLGSGWQWTGIWGGFQGAPIGPHHFLAARHIGGTVGDIFTFNGVGYTTVASFDDATTDLRLWEVSETFPTWAPLYRGSDEVGKGFIVFGRGLTRGSEVRDVASNTLRGWQWGAGDGRLRWGENVVNSVVDGGSYWGALLHATFDATGGVNEAHLAVGDSSAPVFIDDGTGWKLAGIAAAVDGPFNTTNSGSGFNAAIFDLRGLYYLSSPNVWTKISGSSPVPSGFYLTRVSARTAWIDGIAPPQVADLSSDVPLLTSTEFIALAVLLFGVGAFFLRPTIPLNPPAR